ncbi:MAG: Hsp20/alpha crystallin family protein [Actinobacteria bacterium]|nr:Hsp20/alpha crystallin family protein [Actinomycetota bacterium]
MTVRRWDPFTVLARLDDDFDGIVRRSWGSAASGAGWVPPIDMVNLGSDVEISVELPGVDPKDVDIEVHEGHLTISGERKSEHTETAEDHHVLVRELRYGSFRRQFVLPEGLGAENVSADYDKGVLRVRVAGVTKPPEEPKKISVTDRSNNVVVQDN